MELDKNPDSSLQAAYEAILDELTNDLIAQFCFRAHRSLKLGYLFTDFNTNDVEEESDSKTDKEGKKEDNQEKSRFVNCPICLRKLDATRFVYHLEGCMGLGRKSSRNTTKRLILDTYSDDDDDNDTDSTSGKQTKVTKKKSNKKNTGKVKSMNKNDEFGQMSSDTFSNLEEMAMEEKEIFFKRNCGVISKYKGKHCMKSVNCKQHTAEEKYSVRNHYLKQYVEKEDVGEDVQIEVDKVEEREINQYTELDLSRSPSSSENSPLSITNSWKVSSTSNGSTSTMHTGQANIKYTRN